MFKSELSKSEEDLLKLQDEFYSDMAKKIINPAVKFIKSDNPKNYVKEEKPKQMEEVPTISQVPQFVMGDIIEKDDTHKKSKFPILSRGGFPQATRRTIDKAPKNKGSIFSQQMAKRQKVQSQNEACSSSFTSDAMDVDCKGNEQRFADINNSIVEAKKNVISSTLKLESETDSLRRVKQCEKISEDTHKELVSKLEPNLLKYILSKQHNSEETKFVKKNSRDINESVIEAIHGENVAMLSKMSPEEIISEREKLISTMDPTLLNFIQKRQKTNNMKPVGVEMETKNEISNKSNNFNIESYETIPEILSSPNVDKWLHFDNLESEKFEWMKMIEKQIPVKSGEPYEARFDFAGRLQPYVEPNETMTEKTRTLYHHGSEPGRPGYTLQELFQLCRSTVVQQRILALNTIANVLSLQSSGVYDGILELPFEQIIFIVRYALDENVVPIVNASIRAIRNLFYYQIDETCLDSLLGFGFGLKQPILDVSKNVKKEDISNEDELNDQQLAEMDLVRCLLRTDILIRIRYILTTLKPPAETVIYCLELLTRLMRDSQLTMTQVFKCTDLFEFIVKNFIPRNCATLTLPENLNAYGVPLISAVKLLRIAANRSKHIASILVEKWNILDSLLYYLAADAPSADIILLQTEAMFLWATLLHYGFGIEEFMSLQPILLRILNYHVQTTNVSETGSYIIQTHVSGVLSIIGKIAEHFTHPLLQPFIPLLIDGLRKWSNQSSTLNTFKCGHLQVISSMLNCWAIIQTEQIPHSVVDSMISSHGFSKITENIRDGSNLMCRHCEHKTEAALACAGSSIWNAPEHITPILQPKSCLPFVAALSNYLCSKENSESIVKFIRHPNIQKYFSLLNSLKRVNLLNNWYTRIEAQFIVNCYKMAIITQNSLTEQEKYVVYSLAAKYLHIFNLEFKKDVAIILKHIIFSKNFFPTETLMKSLNINDTENVFSNAMSSLDFIATTYIRILGLEGLEKVDSFSQSSLAIRNQEDNILPIDWLYLPIIALYSESQNNEGNNIIIDELDQSRLVTRCLQWITIYEHLFPDLAQVMNVTDKFCRLCCVFLCNSSLFLDEEIHYLLETCLKNILQNENLKNFNFDKEIQGLNSFQDFYTQLLEQYQSVSYGDKLFANFIMVPLMQNQNIKWRKILWSEYAGVVQTIHLNENELLMPMDTFLQPEETDISLIKCYQRAVSFGYLKRSSLLLKIVKHHVDSHIKNKT